MDNTKLISAKQVDIETEMKDAYLQYSMSVIVGRALPDVRDGLKPVHRRVLYAQHEMNNVHNKPYKKSARIVGDVIGKYHPHGDVAVYDTIVRMAQDFSLRYPLIDGQGNFGSIDGDSPAAMRYTEVRMTQIAEELLEDIEKKTVDFYPNYDDSLEIPTVLPAKIPNLLINGSSGIAVGMATNIPPHNLSEVVDGCIHVIDHPDCSIDSLIKIIPAPDFPSSGVISGKEGMVSAYKTGRGVITLKAVAEIEPKKGDRESIIVTEIPYQVNKARLIGAVADMVKDKKIEGISDIRDESSKDGMRIVFDLKKGENSGVILNRLYKYTQLQVRFSMLMLALDKESQPRLFDLKSFLEAFIEHRKDVITKRCLFELQKAEARIHILKGLKKALDEINAIVKIIRESREPAIAKKELIKQFAFSQIQAQAILDMRLARLTGLEREKILNEIKELEKKIKWLKEVLGDIKKVYQIIKDELIAIKKKYGDKRKTVLEAADDVLDDEDLIAKEDVVVTITYTGYIKRIPSSTYRAQNRGGRGIKGTTTREEDFVSNIFAVNTFTTLLVFTNKGRVYWLKVYKLPQGSRTSKGKAIANMVNIAGQEKVMAILPVDEFNDKDNVVLITEKGIIKKTVLSALSRPRASGIIALTIDLNDTLVGAKLSSGQNDIFVATANGMSIRFDESQVRHTGRTARGVKGITLAKDDKVVGVEILQKTNEVKKAEKPSIIMVTERGYGKKTFAKEYRSQRRGGVGLITQKVNDKVGKVVGTANVAQKDDVMVITNKGQLIRLKTKPISNCGRNTQGVRLINLKPGEAVSNFALIVEDNDE